MRKIMSILIITILLVSIFISCSNKEITKHNYTYKGENEFWTAEYKVEGESGFIKKGERQIYTSNAHSILTVTYKKDLSDLSSVKDFKISCKSSTGETITGEEFDENTPLKKKTFTLENSSKDSVIENKDEIIKVSIEINGKKQTIELKNIDI